MPFKSILDVLAERSHSDDLAQVYLADGTPRTEMRWTYADMARNSYEFSARLIECGITPGDRILLAVNPSLEYIAALYGIMALGAIPVPCFPPIRPKELSRFHAITVDASPAAIVIDQMYRERMRELDSRLDGSGNRPTVIYVDEPLTGSIQQLSPKSCSPSDLAMIQYTSGSTGSPKGVCITHDNLISNCEALNRSLGPNPDRVGTSWLPPYHDMGLMTALILSLYEGFPVVFMSPVHFIQQPVRWLQAITHYRATSTVGPNFALDMCVEALSDDEAEGLDLSSVEQLYCGAEPIRAESLVRFERKMAPLGFNSEALIPCYGMAEATLFVSGKRPGTPYRIDRAPKEGNDRIVSCGAVDSEQTVHIVDQTTRHRVADGVIGEIWVAGRNVAAGYYNKPELTAEVFQSEIANEEGKYLRTGDLGFIRNGELFVTGRIKDLIIVNGRNIYPQDIEAATLQADPGFRIAVAFHTTANSSEKIVVAVEADYPEMSAALHSDLVERVRSSVVQEFSVSLQVHVCPKRTIPTTTSGKVCRQEAKRMFLANELRAYEFAIPAMQGSDR